jgi:hypothetical protein
MALMPVHHCFASEDPAPKTVVGAPMTPTAVTVVRWRLFQV